MSVQQQQQFQRQQQQQQLQEGGRNGTKSNSGSPVGAAMAEMSTTKRMPAKGMSVSEWAEEELRLKTERKTEAVRATAVQWKEQDVVGFLPPLLVEVWFSRQI